jgi:integrase
MRLAIPIGEKTVSVLVTPKMNAIRVSLSTSDPATAKARQAEGLAYLERVFAALRTEAPVSLNNRQATALAGRLYRSWASEAGERSISVTLGPGSETIEDEGDLPGEEEAVWAAVLAYFDRVEAKDDLEPPLGPLVDRLLLGEGIRAVDPPSRRLLLRAFWQAMRDAAALRQRNAGGDYSPDPKGKRFPEWVAPKAIEGPSAPVSSSAPLPKGKPSKLTLSGLVEDWWSEAKAVGLRPSTYDNYRNTINQLVAFLGYDDALRVTPEDVVAFKDHRLKTPSPRTGKAVSARTVNDTNLAALKSVFGWAVTNRKLPSNSAEGINVKRGKRPKLRERGFTDQEAKTILAASLRLEAGAERPETYAAKRWVPWLLAYSGARVGEIAQLRKEDVTKTGDHWSIRITPEAGSVKSNEARVVPLHPHLVELGFPEFVASAPGGYLFAQPKVRRLRPRPVRISGRGKRLLTPQVPAEAEQVTAGMLKGLKNHLREWVREYVKDPNVQPNHGWRHLFITRSRACGMDQELRRMITGHSGEAVDERVYGDPAGLYREICKLPRFEV